MLGLFVLCENHLQYSSSLKRRVFPVSLIYTAASIFRILLGRPSLCMYFGYPFTRSYPLIAHIRIPVKTRVFEHILLSTINRKPIVKMCSPLNTNIVSLSGFSYAASTWFGRKGQVDLVRDCWGSGNWGCRRQKNLKRSRHQTKTKKDSVLSISQTLRSTRTLNKKHIFLSILIETYCSSKTWTPVWWLKF